MNETVPQTTSDESNRSRERLEAVVWQFADELKGTWAPHDITGDGKHETFCNWFLAAVTACLGCPVPKILANKQFEWLSMPPGQKAGWYEVDAGTGQRLANKGQPVVAAWCNPNLSKSGHVALLVPQPKGESGVWIAQAGKTCFTQGRLEQGFGRISPKFFAHP